MAVSPAGDATVVWNQLGGGGVIQARRIAADGTLGPTIDLGAGDDEQGDPVVAVDPAGTATVLWLRPSIGGSVITARRIAPDGTPGPTLDLTGPSDHIPAAITGVVVRVAVDRTGVATATWDNFPAGERGWSSKRAKSPATDLSARPTPFRPRVQAVLTNP